MTSAVFLDRDGVLCENRADYVKAWTEFEWIPGAREALRLLARLEMSVVLVTNQSAINRGLTTFDAVRDLHQQMEKAILDDGGRLDGVYVCPHRPDEGCVCRKPGLLLFRQAAEDLELDLSRSYLIGDSMSDVRAGRQLGLRLILVRTGLGEETVAQLGAVAGSVHVAQDVLGAARWVEAQFLHSGLAGGHSTSLEIMPSRAGR